MLEPKLQRDVADKHLPFRATVVTGNSGSYKEHDILNLCEAHHGKWRLGVSRWELFFLDAYAPGLTDNVQRACWQRGRILVTHGGGASAVIMPDARYRLALNVSPRSRRVPGANAADSRKGSRPKGTRMRICSIKRDASKGPRGRSRGGGERTIQNVY